LQRLRDYFWTILISFVCPLRERLL